MEKRFAVMHHEYLNTGGNCMVSVFTVYDCLVKVTRFVVCNDEGFNYQMADTITNEPPEDFDDEGMYIYACDWDALTSEPSYDQVQFADEEFLLFKSCQFEFYKKYCKTCNTTIELPVEWLSAELYNELGQPAIAWHKEHERTVTTDGYDVFYHDDYVSQSEEVDEALQAIVDFQQQLEQDIEARLLTGTIEEYYNKKFVVAFGGQYVELPFDADTYNTINELLRRVINEW